MKRLLVLALFVAACGNVAVKDVPPAGQMWFGQSFDPQTFAIAGRTSSVGTQQPVALVAHLTRSADTQMTIRASHNGTFVQAAAVPVTGSGDVFGYVLGALVQPGDWRYDVVDVGGNVLATGTVTAQ